MRSAVSTISLLVITAFAVVGCSKSEENKTAITSSSATAEQPTAAPTIAPVPSASAEPVIEASAEMKGFMAMLDGNAKDTGAALKKYGAKGLKTADLEMYNLKDPKVTKAEKLGVMQCYTMVSSAGITKHSSRLCWDSSGKLAQVSDKVEP